DEYLDELDEDELDEPFDAFAHEGTDPGVLDPPIIGHDEPVLASVSGEVAVPDAELSGDTERIDEDELAARIAALAAAEQVAESKGKSGRGKRKSQPTNQSAGQPAGQPAGDAAAAASASDGVEDEIAEDARAL